VRKEQHEREPTRHARSTDLSDIAASARLYVGPTLRMLAALKRFGSSRQRTKHPTTYCPPRTGHTKWKLDLFPNLPKPVVKPLSITALHTRPGFVSTVEDDQYDTEPEVVPTCTPENAARRCLWIVCRGVDTIT